MTFTSRRLSLLVAVLSLLSSAPALADVVEVTTTGRGRSETAALDDAFSRAVEGVLIELLTPEAQERHGALLRREIVLRPRRYVASYTVRDGSDREGQFVRQVVVRVSRDRLGDALRARGIDPTAGAQGGASGRPPLAILLKATAGDQTVTTFGSTGSDGGLAGQALLRGLEARGFSVLPATSARVPTVSAESADDMVPLDDAAAAAMAAEIDAGGAVVVGVQAADDGPIRGTRLRGWVARATVRVVDASSGSLVARVTADGSGYGADDAAAQAAAQEDAIAAAMAAIDAALAQYWPLPVSAGQATAVVVRGAVTWSPVAAVIRRLAATSGVAAVHPRQISGDAVLLAVEGRLRPEQIALAVRGARLPKGSVSARASGDAVDVVVTGDSPYSVLEP